MQSIFDDATRAEILRCFSDLSPERQPSWGRLTASQMLAHVGDQLRMALGDIATSHASGIFGSRPVAWLMIYVIPWPKGAKGPREAFTTMPTTWKQDLDELTRLLHRFAERDTTAEWPEHPLFGKLSGKDWGAVSYKHFRHHLRQFGVWRQSH